jgi:hypothetical protein
MILAVVLAAGIFWIEESYSPVLLARKADRIRIESKNWAIHSKSQETGTTFDDIRSKYLVLPFEMMVEPVAFLMNCYAAFVYAIIYLYVFLFLLSPLVAISD